MCPTDEIEQRVPPQVSPAAQQQQNQQHCYETTYLQVLTCNLCLVICSYPYLCYAHVYRSVQQIRWNNERSSVIQRGLQLSPILRWLLFYLLYTFIYLYTACFILLLFHSTLS